VVQYRWRAANQATACHCEIAIVPFRNLIDMLFNECGKRTPFDTKE
jgi:hypothetical protein